VYVCYTINKDQSINQSINVLIGFSAPANAYLTPSKNESSQ